MPGDFETFSTRTRKRSSTEMAWETNTSRFRLVSCHVDSNLDLCGNIRLRNNFSIFSFLFVKQFYTFKTRLYYITTDNCLHKNSNVPRRTVLYIAWYEFYISYKNYGCIFKYIWRWNEILVWLLFQTTRVFIRLTWCSQSRVSFPSNVPSKLDIRAVVHSKISASFFVPTVEMLSGVFILQYLL